MISIAGFRRAFFYFWIFGIISVLLDLDHIIQVYQDGLEFNIENLAYHGTRSLHFPILILTGCFCIITFALFFRFWNIELRRKLYISRFGIKPYAKSSKINSPSFMLKMATNSVVIPNVKVSKPEALIVECPKCKEYIGVIPTRYENEFPCPYCGTIGSI